MPAYTIQKEPIPYFLLKILLYWSSGRNAGKTGFKLQDINPTLRASYQLLHEHMKNERQHQWQELLLTNSTKCWCHLPTIGRFVSGPSSKRRRAEFTAEEAMAPSYKQQRRGFKWRHHSPPSEEPLQLVFSVGGEEQRYDVIYLSPMRISQRAIIRYNVLDTHLDLVNLNPTQ